LTGQQAARFIAVDGLKDEARPGIAGVDGFARRRCIGAIGEDGRIQIGDRAASRMEARATEQDGVDAQAVANVVVDEPVITGPVEGTRRTFDLIPVQGPAVPARAEQEGALVTCFWRKVVDAADESETEAI